jgi:hypothetical protein
MVQAELILFLQYALVIHKSFGAIGSAASRGSTGQMAPEFATSEMAIAAMIVVAAGLMRGFTDGWRVIHELRGNFMQTSENSR